ncbi:MAG: methyltransferase [Patescibacteria group bacterium]|nr:methyltransferase [Patescibacteria group bacterium]
MRLTNDLREKIIGEIDKNYEYEGEIEGIKLHLNEHTYVPHPTTVELIQIASGIIKRNSDIKTVADPGTGSGFIAISLAKKFPDIKFLASDYSTKILKIAQLNAVENNCLNIKFVRNHHSSWLHEFSASKVDFFVINPPYISRILYKKDSFIKENPLILKEPKQAIVTSDNYGLKPIEDIIKHIPIIKPKFVLIQCNNDNLYLIKKITGKVGNSTILTNSQGVPRFILIERRSNEI